MSLIQDKTVSIFRLTMDGDDNDREKYEVAMSNVRMNIQPTSAEYESVVGDGSFGKTFLAFTTQSGIETTMIVTESGSTTISGMKFTVTGISDWSAPNFLPHYELVLTKMGD